MGKILLRSLVVLLAGFVSGCSQGLSMTDPFAGASNNPQGDPNDPNSPAPTPAPDGSITAAQLSGVWVGGCQPFGDQGMRARLTFSGNNTVQVLAQVYTDADCGGSAAVVVNATGTFGVMGLSQTVPLATNFNITTTAVTGTPQSALVAAQLNFVSYCGYTNWQSGVARSVALTNPCLADLPLQGDQIARITNNILYFGNAAGTALDYAIGYNKQ